MARKRIKIVKYVAVKVKSTSKEKTTKIDLGIKKVILEDTK